jgi:hypothetical protein
VWRGTDKLKFCKKVTGSSIFAANDVTELEFARDNKRGKILSMAVKYW